MRLRSSPHTTRQQGSVAQCQDRTGCGFVYDDLDGFDRSRSTSERHEPELQIAPIMYSMHRRPPAIDAKPCRLCYGEDSDAKSGVLRPLVLPKSLFPVPTSR